jgi:hypothetical protein
MGDFLSDVKLTARMFLRTPGFTIAAIITVALGIAANTAIDVMDLRTKSSASLQTFATIRSHSAACRLHVFGDR